MAAPDRQGRGSSRRRARIESVEATSATDPPNVAAETNSARGLRSSIWYLTTVRVGKGNVAILNIGPTRASFASWVRRLERYYKKNGLWIDVSVVEVEVLLPANVGVDAKVQQWTGWNRVVADSAPHWIRPGSLRKSRREARVGDHPSLMEAITIERALAVEQGAPSDNPLLTLHFDDFYSDAGDPESIWRVQFQVPNGLVDTRRRLAPQIRQLFESMTNETLRRLSAAGISTT